MRTLGDGRLPPSPTADRPLGVGAWAAPRPPADAYVVPINRAILRRFIRTVWRVVWSEIGLRVLGLFAALLALLGGVNALNVYNSYVGRDFMTAVAARDHVGFVWYAWVYLVVFGASTVVAVFYRFVEERLGLLWRIWATKRLTNMYLDHRAYHRLAASRTIANPDQRIAEDVRQFSVTTLSFILMFLNGAFTAVAFSGVLWSISPTLFGVAVGYAVVGSLLTILLGRPLFRLNHGQLDKEANFRADLIHVRENADQVALSSSEGRLRARLNRRFEEVADNSRRIIAVNRNLGFFTTGYNYLIQIIPALVVAPLFFRGQVEFGVITQSAMAFAQLLGGFSLIVTQFQSLSLFGAVIARLGSLADAIEGAQLPAAHAIEVVEDPDRLAYEGLTLLAPGEGRPLVKDLSVSVPRGTRVLIIGEDESTKVALFRATAGLWESGSGRILRPPLEQIMFVPERPYAVPGTLRELLVRPGEDRQIPDSQLLATLHALDLEPVLDRVGGLDVEKDWDDFLSLGEQQLLAVARLLLAAPRFAVLDRITTALRPEQVGPILHMLKAHAISYLTIGSGEDPRHEYDVVLELMPDGAWTLTPRTTTV